MAAIAQPAPDVVPDAPVSRPRPRKSAKAQRRVASGVVWIAVFAVLLGGIVALSVAVLRLNITLDKLGQERAKLRADNASLASQLSSAAASARIHALASQKLGLVPADPSETYYVDVTPR
jgi:cell division protein FtsL